MFVFSKKSLGDPTEVLENCMAKFAKILSNCLLWVPVMGEMEMGQRKMLTFLFVLGENIVVLCEAET